MRILAPRAFPQNFSLKRAIYEGRDRLRTVRQKCSPGQEREPSHCICLLLFTENGINSSVQQRLGYYAARSTPTRFSYLTQCAYKTVRFRLIKQAFSPAQKSRCLQIPLAVSVWLFRHCREIMIATAMCVRRRLVGLRCRGKVLA